MRKNIQRQSEYRLTRLGANEDLWVRLKRGKGKSGVDFIPLKKVLNL